jgi:hypothetical protein
LYTFYTLIEVQHHMFYYTSPIHPMVTSLHLNKSTAYDVTACLIKAMTINKLFLWIFFNKRDITTKISLSGKYPIYLQLCIVTGFFE